MPLGSISGNWRRSSRKSRRGPPSQARIEGDGAGGEEEFGQFSKALGQVAAVRFAEPVADERVAEPRQGPHRAAPLAREHRIIIGHASPGPADFGGPGRVIDHPQGQVRG